MDTTIGIGDPLMKNQQGFGTCMEGTGNLMRRMKTTNTGAEVGEESEEERPPAVPPAFGALRNQQRRMIHHPGQGARRRSSSGAKEATRTRGCSGSFDDENLKTGDAEESYPTGFELFYASRIGE